MRSLRFVLAISSAIIQPSKTLSISSNPPVYKSTAVIPRIPANEFEAPSSNHLLRPVIIEGILSKDDCEACCNAIMTRANQIEVDLQEQLHESKPKKRSKKKIEPTPTQIFRCTLEQAIEVIMRKSNTQKSYLTFCEGLLEQDLSEDEDIPQRETIGTFEDLHDIFTEARERVFADQDWFPYFPISTQPSDAVILAGAGATSTLHRDPFEWTGTSLCLEGTKIWRFIEPEASTDEDSSILQIDKALKSYRLESMAWEEGSIALSAGWQSDYSLFHRRLHARIPSARKLAEIEDEKDRDTILENIGTSLDILRPNFPTAATLKLHTAIQRPGDLLIIPAHWWHQTLGLEPSLAIASQRCGTADAEMVFQHILNQVRTKSEVEFPTAAAILASTENVEDAVEELFNELSQA